MDSVLASDAHHIPFESFKQSKALLNNHVDSSKTRVLFQENKHEKMIFQTEKSVSSMKHRHNRHLPLEVSSRTQVPVPTAPLSTVKKPKSRDPRFSDMCGALNPNAFAKAYSFCDNLLAQEKKEVLEALRQGRNSLTVKEKEKLKQKLDQYTSLEQRRKRITAEQNLRLRLRQEEKQRILETGKTPFVYSKAKVKCMLEEAKFEELKNTNKLEKHLVRKRKKRAAKDSRLVPLKRRCKGESDEC